MSGQDILIDQLRADVERLTMERDEARANYAFMVERAADQKLDGYRELGAKAAAAEERAGKAERERDEARAETDAYKEQMLKLSAELGDMDAHDAKVRP